MPIRMVQDQDNSQTPDNYPGGGGGDRNNPGGGGGGGGGGIFSLLLMFLFRKPKLLILLLAIAGAMYFFGGGKLFLGMAEAAFSKGATLDKSVYSKAEVFEPLADNAKNPLPNKYSLEQYCPPRLNQGSQGSCVAWSSAYAARSILYARQAPAGSKIEPFSPSYLYNQIKLPNCQGSYIKRATDAMMQNGALPFSQFAYDENSCSKEPTQSEKQRGAQFNIKGYQRLSRNDDDLRTDMLAIKQNVSQGAPVLIGMLVGGSFMQNMLGQEMWIPTAEDYQQQGFGGHCMCVIGYDDYKFGNEGGFQIMNSWGPEWGKNGIGWVRYKDFDYFVQEAYGLYPMGSGVQFNENKLKVALGIISNDTKANIPLIRKENNVFATKTPIKKMSKFKLEVTNNIECYTYILGQETDGSSYVLFPYTPKHSPYCGITGTRVFPKDYSMQADNIGNKDFVAIIVTKKPVDFKVLNIAVNASKQTTFAGKVNEALASQLVGNVNFVAGNNVQFECDLNGKNAVVSILEIDKN